MTCDLCCDLCGSALVQPPCDDGHGADCPDFCCVDCGAAIVVGSGIIVTVTQQPAAKVA